MQLPGGTLFGLGGSGPKIDAPTAGFQVMTGVNVKLPF